MNYWQGKTIRLRGIEPGDAATFAEWNLDSERARRLDFVWPPVSLAAVTEWAERQSRQKLEQDAFHWLIETLDTQIPVGSISTHDCHPHSGTFSYGVDIAETQRRRGCAAEAIRLVLGYYFNELRYQKVTVMVHADNEASLRLHRKLGFIQEGLLRRMIFTQGSYVDAVWLGMTVEEYRAGELFQGRQAHL